MHLQKCLTMEIPIKIASLFVSLVLLIRVYESAPSSQMPVLPPLRQNA